MSYGINKAAVIGAGTMGAAIAAHLANAGIPVYLLDIVPAEARRPDISGDDSRQQRNRLAIAGLERAKKSSPPAFFTRGSAQLVTPGNVEDDLGLIREADMIVEAVVENLDVKRGLMARLEAVRKSSAIVTSNTSGIPISAIAEGRSPDFRAHFLGTHFFNPPRYLKLLEVIPTDDTSAEVVRIISRFAERRLGKGVVICKDTPNFIANRLASMTYANSLSYVLEHGYTVGEVDALTGPLIGRPKTATFRLSDLVGLDVAGDVRTNLYPLISHDPHREVLRAPRMVALISQMLQRGLLGNKSGKGFYTTVEDAEGKREFQELNLETMEYEPAKRVRYPSVDAARKIEPLPQRIKALCTAQDRAGALVWAVIGWGLAYAAHVAPEIAGSLAAIDDAVRWGFAHEMGPFEIWDALGVREIAKRMAADGTPAPPWVDEMLAAGKETFYQYDGVRRVACYNPRSRGYEPLPEKPNVIVLRDLKDGGKEIKRNRSASLIDLGDGVACLEFHSKMNALDQQIAEMAKFALEEVSANYAGLVIGNQDEQFCVGANIFEVAIAAQQGAWEQLDSAVKSMQDGLMAIRFCPKPVVAAPFSMALGGGAEVSMAAARICASAELYMGEVEVGVGLIPAAGGCKELLRRVVSPPMRTEGADVLPFVRRAFETIALAKVSGSAPEAREMGFLDGGDRIVMNRDYLLSEAKRLVLEMEPDYVAPVPLKNIYAAGRDVLAGLYVAVHSMEAAGYASAHDALIARKLAYVLCGGDLSEPQWVDEQYVLDLEREAFLELLHEPKTLERIWHMLQTGKPLRN